MEQSRMERRIVVKRWIIILCLLLGIVIATWTAFALSARHTGCLGAPTPPRDANGYIICTGGIPSNVRHSGIQPLLPAMTP
jgi:hypothetical protein